MAISATLALTATTEETMDPATGSPSATGLRHFQIVVDDSSVHVVQVADAWAAGSRDW
jgi:hypothetical protein